MKCKALIALFLFSLMLGLAGCGDSAPAADFTFISGSEHNHLDPQKMSWNHDIRLAHCLFEPLVRVDFSDMTVRPAAALRWDLSPDGRTYTFQLREEARWSNGQPVTAHDFIYTWRRALLPDMAADYTKLLYPIAGAKAFYDWRAERLAKFTEVRALAESSASAAAQDAAKALWDLTEKQFAETVGLSAPDDRTLVITLEHRVPYFLELLAFATFMPVHRASVDQATSLDAATGMLRMDATYWSDPQRLVTNGPYRLADRRFKRYVHLLANEHYWNRAAMKNGSILERISTDPQNAVMAYDQGKADFLPDVPTASELAADLLRQERRDLHTQPMAGTYFYNFNCEAKLSSGADNPLADARVRRALSMAINRQTLVQKITRLNQPVAQTYIPPDALPDYQPPVEAAVTEDVPAARQLLADAGYPQGRGLDGLSILYNTGHGHETIAQAIQAMWKEQLGVIVTLRGLEGKAFSERLKKRDYTIARASWFGDYPDPTSWLQKMVTGDGNNDCGWSNGEYDALLAEADGEANPIKRMKLLRDAEAIVLREQPMALLYQYVNLYLFDPTKVRGLELNAWARWQLEMVENN